MGTKEGVVWFMSSKFKPRVTEKSFKEHINSIINNPYNAIVELIANAHDAGATELYINWDVNPLNSGLSKIEFKDNGQGMSNDEFKNIWGELSYDRLKNTDGDFIEVFNDKGNRIHRKVYGKNGKGRHSPFAFSNKYEVKTIKDGECSIFEISEDTENGFLISEKQKYDTEEEKGTIISFKINKIENNLPIEVIKETIATRFLKDASFKIFLNNELIELEDISNENKEELTCTYKGEEIKIIKIKSNTNSHYMKFHGISWKFGNRIFSDNNWDNIIDGRSTLAKKYNFIISAEFLSDSLNDTMTGFEDDSDVEEVKECIYNCIRNSLNKDLQIVKNEEKREIIKENFNSIKKLGVIDKKDIVDFINEVQDKCPNIKRDDLKATAEIFIKLKESNHGYELLHKLAKFSRDDYDSLYEILDAWSIYEAKAVLDEIKWRLDVVRELKSKVNNPDTDELHELQPLFDNGLWIFGPEYESIEFTSNKTLSTVIRELFKSQDINVENPRLRPDLFIVVPNDKSIAIHSSDHFDENGEVDGIDKVLIVELKKGGFNITLNEIHQTQIYIQQLIDSKHIKPHMDVVAYVLGSTVSVSEQTMGDNVKILPIPYDIILRRAEKRLFNLDKKIRDIKNISDDTGDEIFDELMSQESLDDYMGRDL